MQSFSSDSMSVCVYKLACWLEQTQMEMAGFWIHSFCSGEGV